MLGDSGACGPRAIAEHSSAPTDFWAIAERSSALTASDRPLDGMEAPIKTPPEGGALQSIENDQAALTASGLRKRMCSSRNCFSSTTLGAWVSKH